MVQHNSAIYFSKENKKIAQKILFLSVFNENNQIRELKIVVLLFTVV